MIKLNFIVFIHQKHIFEIKVYQFKQSLMFLVDYIYFILDYHRKLATLEAVYLNIKYLIILFINFIEVI
jgi:hypothetical protein